MLGYRNTETGVFYPVGYQISRYERSETFERIETEADLEPKKAPAKKAPVKKAAKSRGSK